MYISRGITDITHLEYTEKLSSEYSKNHLEIYYDETADKFKKIYIYNSQYGTITIKNNKKETHKWETEDEAQEGSYLKRNFQIICLDGIEKDPSIENKIINENMIYIKTLNLNENDLELINKAIKYIKETD